MRQRFSQFLFASAVLAGLNILATAPAFSQYYDRPYGDQTRAREDRAVFDRARMDLDRASTYPYASPADRKRFFEARRDLIDFASRFDQGLYERHQLDHAIDRMEKVVRENSLSPQDRGALEDDLRRMRDFREFRKRLS